VSTGSVVPEARPRAESEWIELPCCPDAHAWALARDVQELVHFTLHNNLIGILASGYLKSKYRAERDEQVEHVYLPNAPGRSRDYEWIDYANLSVTRINSWLFGSSKNRWHQDSSWVVLSFDPIILSHPGVVFATTNNAYPECRRAEGLSGLQRLFDDPVVAYNGRRSTRSGLPLNRSTDQGAEVLYPGQLSIEYLRRIYVQTEHAFDDVHGVCAGIGLSIEIAHEPTMFS
jgi:hypothetical protein